MLLRSGTYVGDGVNDREIPVSIVPALVFVKQEGSTGSDEIRLRSSAWTANTSSNFDGTSITTTGIRDFTTTGFKVGTNANVNGNGLTYHWMAIDADDAEWTTGSYTGTGVDDTGISFPAGASNLAATLAWVQRTSVAASPCWKNASMGGTNSLVNGSGATFITTGIKSLGTGSFTVGTNGVVNTNLSVYHYFAFRSGGGCRTGTYNGDDADDRSIPSVLEPQMVFVKRRTSTEQRHACRLPTPTGDASWVGGVAGLVTDAIQAFATTSFQIGTRAAVNLSGAGNDYYWFIISVPVPPPTIVFVPPVFPRGAIFETPDTPYTNFKTTLQVHHMLNNARIV